MKENQMRLKLLVQTQEFQNWPATKDRPASTSHNLVCVDMSQPADARMTESISYRLKDEEIPKWGSREQNFVPLVLSLWFSASCVFAKAAEPHFQGQAEH